MIVVRAIEAFGVIMTAAILGWALVDWNEVKELRKKVKDLQKVIDIYKNEQERLVYDIENLYAERDHLLKELGTRKRRIKLPKVDIYWYEPKLKKEANHET